MECKPLHVPLMVVRLLILDNVYIVWGYDDGIQKVYSNREGAEAWIREGHDKEWWHEEDMMVVEEKVFHD